MKKYLILIMLVMSFFAVAQEGPDTQNPASGEKVEMADQFRAEGKIYVVLAVVFIILAGLFTYIIITDRKLSRLERQFNEQKQDGMKLN